MDTELKRYLNAISILLSLNIGFQATALWVSPATYTTDVIIPPVVGAIFVGGLAWILTGALDEYTHGE
ncbi:MAG: hypothetical protein ABEH58_03885 [Haloplanus sp.]